nr:hypothetical protein [Sunxiuqinia sp.]
GQNGTEGHEGWRNEVEPRSALARSDGQLPQALAGKSVCSLSPSFQFGAVNL